MLVTHRQPLTIHITLSCHFHPIIPAERARSVNWAVARNSAGWACAFCIAPTIHHLSVTLASLHDQLPAVNAAVLQRKRRTTLTQMRKEKPPWACYVLFHTVGTIACSGMNRTPGPGMPKPWPRCAKSNASLHKSAPGAPRLFASKQASQSSDWGSSTHRPRRSSWCHESWEDEGGHAGLRVARDHGMCIPRALLVVQLKCGATGAPTAACRPHRGAIPPLVPLGLPRYSQPESSTALLPRATSSWDCTCDRKR